METPSYNFDVHKKGSFMHHWIYGYMEATRRVILDSDISLAGKTVYDIGIGRGRSLALFKGLGVKKVIGLDINADVVAFARNQSARVKLDLEIIIDDLKNTYLKSTPSNSCDVVSLMNILCYLDAMSRGTILLEARRIVKPGGVVIITDGCQPSLMWFFNTLSLMGRIFSTEEKLRRALDLPELLVVESSNYFYFFNKPADMLGKIFGPAIFTRLNMLMRLLKVPPSTKSFVFRKP